MIVKYNNRTRERAVVPGQYNLQFYRKYEYEELGDFKQNQHLSDKKPDFFRVNYKDLQLLPPALYSNNSRYSKVPTVKQLGQSYHATNRIRFIPRSSNDTVFEVTNSTENRLDRISLICYNDPQYWWVIAEANFIFDAISDIPVGATLRIPPLDAILGLYT